MIPDTPPTHSTAIDWMVGDTSLGLKIQPLWAVDFHGAATLQKKDAATRQAQKTLIPTLNGRSSHIAERISEEIRRSLPAGTDISVEIQFSHGSITWLGIVTVMDTVGRLTDGIDLGKRAIQLIEFLVNKILREEIEPVAAIAKIATHAKRRSLDPINRLVSFLWWCSGAVPELLRESRTEWAKFIGIGGAVLSTWVLATASSMYALMVTLGSDGEWVLPCALLALIWGVVIFNLDRYIVSTLHKADPSQPWTTRLRSVGPAVPRLFIAFLLAVTISKPLELGIFKDAIVTEMSFAADSLVNERKSKLELISDSRIDDLRRERAAFDERLNRREAAVDSARNTYIDETDGSGGSGTEGDGPIAKVKLAQLEALQTALASESQAQASRRRQIDRQLDSLALAHQDSLTSFRTSIGTGFLPQLNALAALSRKESATKWASYAVMALIIMIEISPVLVKLLAPYGPYDAKLQLRNETEIETARFRRRFRVEVERHHFEKLREAEKELESEYYRLSEQKRREKMQEVWESYGAHVHVGAYASTDEMYEAIRETLFHKRTD
jgi:hypothetical protein